MNKTLFYVMIVVLVLMAVFVFIPMISPIFIASFTGNIVNADLAGEGDIENPGSSGTSGSVRGSSSSSSGGTGSSGSVSSSAICYYEQISYSVKNFVVENECLNLVNEICYHRQVTCSGEIHNLDSVSGYFGLALYIEEESRFNESIEEHHSEVFIEANDFITFENTFDIESTGLEGNANKNLICRYFVEKVPKKEICL